MAQVKVDSSVVKIACEEAIMALKPKVKYGINSNDQINNEYERATKVLWLAGLSKEVIIDHEDYDYMSRYLRKGSE